MKRTKAFILILLTALNTSVFAADQAGFAALKNELLRSGVCKADVLEVEKAILCLLDLKVKKENLVKMVTDLKHLELKKEEINAALTALSSLIRTGERPVIASKIMALAISQAMKIRLTGKAAAVSIVDVIEHKRADIIRLKAAVEEAAIK